MKRNNAQHLISLSSPESFLLVRGISPNLLSITVCLAALFLHSGVLLMFEGFYFSSKSDAVSSLSSYPPMQGVKGDPEISETA